MRKTFSTTEWCNECEFENNYKRVAEGTRTMVCKNCGKTLLLCTKCMDEIGDCDPNDKRAFCYKQEN